MLVDGPHFQATDEGELIFLLSDGDSSRRPAAHDILELEEESETVRQNYYLHVPLEHPDSHRWRAEIAKYLAPLVLGSTYYNIHSLTHLITSTHSLPTTHTHTQCPCPSYIPSPLTAPFPDAPFLSLFHHVHLHYDLIYIHRRAIVVHNAHMITYYLHLLLRLG